MKRTLLLILAVLLPLLVTAAEDGAAPSPVDDLLHKSGLWRQIAQIEPLVQLGVDQGHQQQGTLDGAGLSRLKQAVASTFAADRLRLEVKRHLTTSLTPNEINKALAWLSSDLGRQFTALEESSSEASQYEARQQAAAQFGASLSAQRRALLEKLVTRMGVGEASASILINTTLALARGVAAVSPGGATSDTDRLATMLQGQRKQLVAHYQQEAIQQFAYTYRTISDGDLVRYLNFAASPVGRKYHAATIQALDSALTGAASDVGRELVSPRESAGLPAGQSTFPRVFTFPADVLATGSRQRLTSAVPAPHVRAVRAASLSALTNLTYSRIA